MGEAAVKEAETEISESQIDQEQGGLAKRVREWEFQKGAAESVMERSTQVDDTLSDGDSWANSWDDEGRDVQDLVEDSQRWHGSSSKSHICKHGRIRSECVDDIQGVWSCRECEAVNNFARVILVGHLQK